MEVTRPATTILSALRDVSFQTHSAEPRASFLLSVIPSSHPHLNKKKKVLKMKGASSLAALCIFSSVRKGMKRKEKKKKKETLTMQKVSQL